VSLSALQDGRVGPAICFKVSKSLVGWVIEMLGYRIHISEHSRSIMSGFPSNLVNKSINSPYVGPVHVV